MNDKTKTHGTDDIYIEYKGSTGISVFAFALHDREGHPKVHIYGRPTQASLHRLSSLTYRAGFETQVVIASPGDLTVAITREWKDRTA